MTKHSSVRMQQRSIPKIVSEWLAEFGEEKSAGKGCMIVYFSKKSKKLMENALGKRFVQENKKYLSVYEVISSSGAIITAGWRTRRIKNY